MPEKAASSDKEYNRQRLSIPARNEGSIPEPNVGFQTHPLSIFPATLKAEKSALLKNKFQKAEVSCKLLYCRIEIHTPNFLLSDKVQE